MAVRALHDEGEPMALATYEVYSPADPRTPHQQGRTDRAGWLAFVPDAPGRWRVRVLEADGHGLDVQVEAEAPGRPAGGTTAAAPARPGGGYPLRLALGLGAIGALFGGLLLARRRKGDPR